MSLTNSFLRQKWPPCWNHPTSGKKTRQVIAFFPLRMSVVWHPWTLLCMSQWFQAVFLSFPLHCNYSPWRGWKNPPSCNQSCCLFSCQTWGPWALRSLSLLEALLSLRNVLSPSPSTMRPCLLCFIRPLQTNLPKRSGTQTPRRSCHPILDKMDQSPVLSTHLEWMFPTVLWASEGRAVFSGGGPVQIFRLGAVKTLWQLLPTLKSKPHRTHKSHEPWHRSVGRWRPFFSSVLGVSFPLT